MIPIDQVRDAAVSYVESHAVDLGRYIVQAVAIWIRNRRHAEQVIQEGNDSYTREFAEIESHMRGDGADR